VSTRVEGYSALTLNSDIALCIGSQNPVKVRGVVEAFSKFYRVKLVRAVRAETGLPPQPMGLSQIIEGARKRAELSMSSECDFAVGVEAGFYLVEGEPFDVEAASIVSRTGEYSLGFSPSFPVPRVVYSAIASGVLGELEEAVERLFNVKGVGDKEGFIGILTRRACDRWVLSYYATLMALVKLVNRDLYTRREL